MKRKTSALGQQQTEVLVPERNSGRYVRRGPTLQATPSLRLSLTVKSNDNYSLVFPTRDSVTSSTGRHKFDINRFAIMVPKVVASEHSACSLTLKHGVTNEIRLSDLINFGAYSV